jgi:hypothetical protein
MADESAGRCDVGDQARERHAFRNSSGSFAIGRDAPGLVFAEPAAERRPLPLVIVQAAPSRSRYLGARSEAITGSFMARVHAPEMGVDDQNNPASVHLLGMTLRSVQR